MLMLVIFMSCWLVMSSCVSMSMGLSVGALGVLLFISFFIGNSFFMLPSIITFMFSGVAFNAFIVSLSIFVVFMMVLVSMKYSYLMMSSYGFILSSLSLCFICVLFFVIDNLMVFYILFEFSLIPTLVLLLKWGYQPERLQAGTYFMMYTISASLPLLFMIMKMSNELGTLSMSLLGPCMVLVNGYYSYLFYLCIMFAFLVKVPMWGVHLWLPKAHVEAPVSGSMILAGILLKLGGYGLLKIFIYTMNYSDYLNNLVLSVNLWGVVVVSLVCMRQTDMKSIIAYSSVIHMGLMVVGIFSYSMLGWLGAMVMMISHGISSPGMFSLANFNYEMTGSRVILFQKGLMNVYPICSLFWFLLLSANMAAPPSLNLGGEMFICMSVLKLGFMLFLILGFSTFFAAGYNLYIYSSQQGSVGSVVLKGEGMKSNYILVMLLHVFPVFFLTLSMSLLMN